MLTIYLKFTVEKMVREVKIRCPIGQNMAKLGFEPNNKAHALSTL